MRRLLAALAGACAAVLGAATVLVSVLVPAHPAAAATLTEVTNFGANPGNLRMHLYVPNNVQQNPGIVLAMHTCGGSGPGFYSSTEFASLADRYGFIVIYPSASKKMNCFDNWSEASKVRGGQTDPVSLMSMVNWVRQQYNGDANRVFATGASSGAMMTNAMLALYPEVFKAGAAFMGVPFTCFPNEAAYNPAGNSAPCVGKSAQQWGDAVRGANPGYQGPWPRMQLWHGTADNVVAYSELEEEVKQWTNVHGMSQTPTATDTPQSGWNRRRWIDGSGTVKVEAYTIQGAGHSLPMGGMAAVAIQFFGLNASASPSPSPSPSPSASPSPSPSPSPSASPSPSPSPSASPSASPSPSPSPSPSASPSASPSNPQQGACRITYRPNTWNNGFTAEVTITNTGAAPVNGWTVTWAWSGNQQVVNAWNATVTQSGTQVVARNVSYNPAIPAGGSTNFGFQGTYSGTNGTPAGFALNGTACTIG
ncbi:PHB depolymerase family esterase [Microbispora sp. H11081]|uniref:extracellular catalytic domain type 1 short-chain-length polyhydroxyalkanoate depolymerase n=1 Tax=Microbispora sp. H11081 TaxID=2729107 RepID=UPI001474256D|nr:PHB depolymerase family esterase [Microbispora sp. H11081]